MLMVALYVKSWFFVILTYFRIVLDPPQRLSHVLNLIVLQTVLGEIGVPSLIVYVFSSTNNDESN